MRNTTLIVLGLSVSVALLAVAPTSGAATVDCGAATNFIVVAYHCTYQGAGASGTVNWCPSYMCDSTLYCEAEVSPLYATCNFP